jgi:hypothetical protein
MATFTAVEMEVLSLLLRAVEATRERLLTPFATPRLSLSIGIPSK